MVNIKVIKTNTQIWDHRIPYFFECPVGTGRLESMDGEITPMHFSKKDPFRYHGFSLPCQTIEVGMYQWLSKVNLPKMALLWVAELLCRLPRWIDMDRING